MFQTPRPAAWAGGLTKSVRILLGLLALLAMPAFAQQPPGALIAPAESYASRLEGAAPAMKAKVQDLQARARAENWGFEPAYTSALDRSIQELTGAKPGPSVEEALARQAFADKAVALYQDALANQKIPSAAPPGGASCAAAVSFDWRTAGKVTPVKDQGRCAACWAFTATSALESSYLIHNLGTVDASEQHVLNCTPDSTCDGGYLSKALDLLVAHGTDAESAERYRASKVACANAQTPLRLVAWRQINPDWKVVVNPELIKAALCQYGPVVTRMIVDAPFQSYPGGGVAFRQVTRDLTVDSDGAHFLTIVGWDNRKGSHGAWLVKNSWGTRWGDQGYAWIEYGANLIGHNAAWVLAPNARVSLNNKFQALVQEHLGISDAMPITPQSD
jgi:C1A family cysteine protease